MPRFSLVTTLLLVLWGVTSAWETDCSATCEIVTSAEVCGSDNVTYGSFCLLVEKQCRDPDVTKLHDGPCERPTPMPTPLTHPPNATPMPANDTTCVRACSPAHRPVCGSNNITYHNACEFEVAQCEDDTIKMAHLGPCTTNLPKIPAFCEDPCAPEQLEDNPLCGSDGVTYENTCDFRLAFCASESKLSVSYRGVCLQSKRKR